MRLLLVLVALLTFTPSWSQKKDKVVRAIEKLRREGKLDKKSFEDKTIVGLLDGYYYKGSLVLINSLADAEAAGTETLYYLKKGTLWQAFIMSATFPSHAYWSNYYSKHMSNENCFTCHGEHACVVIVITFGVHATATQFEDGKSTTVSREDREKWLLETSFMCEELKLLLNEL